MNQRETIRHLLVELETQLKSHHLWQAAPPEAQAFDSTLPFCADTMAPHQWMQWVFIPRMLALLDAGAAMPQACAITPLAEAFYTDAQDVQVLLVTLRKIDQVVADTP